MLVFGAACQRVGAEFELRAILQPQGYRVDTASRPSLGVRTWTDFLGGGEFQIYQSEMTL